MARIANAMEHHRIFRVTLGVGQAWPDAAQTLGAQIDRTDVEIRVVDSGDRSGWVMLAGPDEAKLEALVRDHVEPWLSGLSLAQPATIEAGRAVLRYDARSELDAMNDEARLEHFVRTVTESDLVWGLYGDSWARAEPDGDAQVLPFWPTAELAARCIAGAWESFAPRSIELDAFLEQWLTGMVEDGITAAISPTSSTPGAKVPAARLLEVLRAAQDDDSP